MQRDDGTTFATFATFGGGTHIVQRALQGRQGATVVRGEDVKEYFDKLLAESDKTPALGTLLALDMAARAPAAGAPVKEQKKRKPKFSPAKYEEGMWATTSEEEKDDDIPPPPPPAPLEGLRSPTEPFTLTELEDMHH